MKALVKVYMIMVIFGALLYASENSPTKEEVARLYVATFNRAPDNSGLDYWVYSSGLTLSQIAQSFFDQPETKQLYPDGTANRDFIQSVYLNLFNRDPDSTGWDYWENELNLQHFTKNMFIIAVINGALATTGDPDDAKILSNKTTVGLDFASNGLSDEDKAKEVMSDINSSEESVENALSDIKTIASTPKVISKLDSATSLKSVAVKGSYLFAGNYDGDLYTIDISDPLNPHIVSTIKLPDDTINDLATNPLNQNHLIVANNRYLTVVDVSNPKAPTLFKTIDIRGYARGLASSGSMLYIASGYGDIAIYDLQNYTEVSYTASDGTQKSYIPVAGDYTDSIITDGSYIYTSDSFSDLITVSSISSKAKEATIKKPSSLYNPRRDMFVAPQSSTLYVADFEEGLLIYDISSVTNAILLSKTKALTPSSAGYSEALGVQVSKDETKAYVADHTQGLAIYDITSKTSPLLKQILSPSVPYSSYEMILLSDDERYIYAVGSKGLEIVDLNPLASTQDSATLLDLSNWTLYGTAKYDGTTLTVGDDIGADANDIDKDQNLWNRYTDAASTGYDYDVILSKKSYTPPIDLKFSGTISTTSLGYNEIGFAYKNSFFENIFGGGSPISSRLAMFVYRWEDGADFDLYVDKFSYINTGADYLSGDFEIYWDGKDVTFYYNGNLIASKPLVYTNDNEVVIFFKNYESPFKITKCLITDKR